MERELKRVLSELKDLDSKLVVSFSGPSSSGKSTLISLLIERIGPDLAGSWPSISRSMIKKEEDRFRRDVQFQMLNMAIKRDSEAVRSGFSLVLLDRNPIDGYVYVKKYGFSQEDLDLFYRAAEKTVSRYDLVILLNRRVFVEDEIRTEIDRDFEDFNEEFKKYWPDKSRLVEVEPLDIERLYQRVREIILAAAKSKLVLAKKLSERSRRRLKLNTCEFTKALKEGKCLK